MPGQVHRGPVGVLRALEARRQQSFLTGLHILP